MKARILITMQLLLVVLLAPRGCVTGVAAGGDGQGVTRCESLFGFSLPVWPFVAALLLLVLTTGVLLDRRRQHVSKQDN